jgi:protease I
VDRPLDDVRAEDYDLLVLPGGHGPEKVRRNQTSLRVARAMVLAHDPVASICHGIQVLISAQVVEGRNATCWPGIADDLKEAGAIYHDSEVVVDGRLVTSRKPEDLPAFCREIVRLADRLRSGAGENHAAGAESLARSA